MGMTRPTNDRQFANFQSVERFQRNLIARLIDAISQQHGTGDGAHALSKIGKTLAAELAVALGDDPHAVPLGSEQIAAILVELKRRIGAKFQVVSVSSERIVLKNSYCPFAESAVGRPMLCELTSSVMGRMVAGQTGYARVHIPKSIAQGDDGCIVVIELTPSQAGAAVDRGLVPSREYRNA